MRSFSSKFAKSSKIFAFFIQKTNLLKSFYWGLNLLLVDDICRGLKVNDRSGNPLIIK